MLAIENKCSVINDSTDSRTNDDELGRNSAILHDQIPKSRWSKIWPVLACGSGLFSDGYVQSVSGRIYCFQKDEQLMFT